jgi:hypothetical protein
LSGKHIAHRFGRLCLEFLMFELQFHVPPPPELVHFAQTELSLVGKILILSTLIKSSILVCIGQKYQKP